MKQSENAGHQPLASVESNLFGSLAGFLLKVTKFIRDAELDGEGEQLAAERVGKLLAGVTDEVVRTKNIDIQHRLDAIYEEMQQVVKDLAMHKGGK